jgi:hypothetical protein
VVRAKVAASAFARGYLNGIVTSVFQNLQDAGEGEALREGGLWLWYRRLSPARDRCTQQHTNKRGKPAVLD